jgi:copper chaperone CopZ
MKNLWMGIFALLSFTFTADAQTKAQQTVKIATPTVQCDMCKKKIETYLNRYDGIALTVVNIKRKETTVKFLTDRINIEEIKAAISSAGYDANEIPALEEPYKRLPLCCKKPGDGGGMKKN